MAAASAAKRDRVRVLAFLRAAAMLGLAGMFRNRRGAEPAPARPIARQHTFETLAARSRDVTFLEPPPGRRGYDEESVDNFLDEIVAACEARRAINPSEVRNVAFPQPAPGRKGYDERDVDEFLDEVEAAMEHLGR